MKVTIQQLTNSTAALNELSQKPMKVQPGYRVAIAMKEVNRHLEPFYEVREKLIKKYDGKTDQGPEIIFSEDPEGQEKIKKEFIEELKPVMDEEVSLNGVKPLSLKKLGSMELQPWILLQLDWLVVE
jgi:hypothetical protein